MKINTKTRYGLRTMIELAINSNSNNGLYQKDISKSQDISFKYLDQIIAALKSSNLISNVAGKKSGYRLSKNPGAISIYDIYKAFNSDLRIIDCLDDDALCVKNSQCASQRFWARLNKQIIEFMKAENLDDMAQKQKEIDQQQQEIVFHI